jgi:hypothetical protein
MADIDIGTLFSVLNATNKTAEEESPYHDLASFSDSFANQALQMALSRNKQTGEPNYGLGEGLAVALGSGLLSGFTGGLNRSYVDEQNELARSVLSDALAGRTITRPERLSPSGFTPIANAGMLFQAQQRINDETDVRKAARDSLLKNPTNAIIAKEVLGVDLPKLAGLPKLEPLTTSDVGTDTTAAPGGKLDRTYLDTLIATGGDPVEARKRMDEIRQESSKNRISQTTVGQIHDKMKAVSQLDDLSVAVDERLPTSYLGDTVAGIEASLASRAPSSTTASYNRKVIPLADELAKAFAGTARQYNIRQIQDSLSTAFGKGPQAIKDTIEDYRSQLLEDAEGQAQKLLDSNYKGAAPLLEHVQSVKGNVTVPTQTRTTTAAPETTNTSIPTTSGAPTAPPPGLTFEQFQAWKRKNQ